MRARRDFALVAAVVVKGVGSGDVVGAMLVRACVGRTKGRGVGRWMGERGWEREDGREER
jgi:hypothetical protein